MAKHDVKAVGSRAEVWHGNAKHTSGGLTKKDLMKNKYGRIVSKKKHALGKKAYQKNCDKMAHPYAKKGRKLKTDCKSLRKSSRKRSRRKLSKKRRSKKRRRSSKKRRSSLLPPIIYR